MAGEALEDDWISVEDRLPEDERIVRRERRMSNIELPWDINQTIINLDLLRVKLMFDVRKKNFEGCGEKDAQEINFDFSRAINALRLMKNMEEKRDEQNEVD